MSPLDNEGWASDTLTHEGQKAFFKAAQDRQESQEKDAHTLRRDRFVFCAVCAAFGLLGFGAAVAMVFKQPAPPQPNWVLVHDAIGAVEQPVTVKDAPKLFNVNVREKAMRDFLVACEGYVPEVWAKLDYHACMIQATPDEQRRRDADIGKGGKRYPPAIFGTNGWAMPTAYQAFVPLEVTGVEPHQIFHYRVRYERTEVIGGKELRPRWTADMYFSFHPDLSMTPADRLLNLPGMQVSSFSTTPD